MKTKEELQAAFVDELSGMLLASFAEDTKQTDFARNGLFMVQQLRRARMFLDRVHAYLAETPPKPPEKTNGQNNGTPSTAGRTTQPHVNRA